MVWLCIKWNDVKEILCGENGKMSSKRIIALMGMVTLCRLAIYTTHSDGKVDNNILAVLTVIVLTAAAIATFPQILELFSKIKGTPEKTTKETKETKEISIEDKTKNNGGA